MKELEKNEKLINLFFLYEKLLTKKQNIYFNLYYLNDLSLQEIADNYAVSKNAVYDTLKKVISKLKNYENKLNLLKNKQLRTKLINEYLKTNNKKLLIKLIEMDDDNEKLN